MGIITDFFIATPQEVEATYIHDFPIGPTLYAKGVDTIALDIFARLLTGSTFKNVLEHRKPDYSMLEYSEFGEVDPESAIPFFRHNYKQEVLDEKEEEWDEKLDDHIRSMPGDELNEWIFSKTVDQFHPTFVEYLASCPLERLQQVVLQWQEEWADVSRSSSVKKENFFPFWQKIAVLAQQALSEKKHLYYYFSL